MFLWKKYHPLTSLECSSTNTGYASACCSIEHQQGQNHVGSSLAIFTCSSDQTANSPGTYVCKNWAWMKKSLTKSLTHNYTSIAPSIMLLTPWDAIVDWVKVILAWTISIIEWLYGIDIGSRWTSMRESNVVLFMISANWYRNMTRPRSIWALFAWLQ